MNRICFISNHFKTYFFEKIALKLRDKGYSISWIVHNDKYYKHLIKNWDSDGILLIRRDCSQVGRKAENLFIEYNDIILSDRVLCKDIKSSKEYLNKLHDQLTQFIEKHDITTVVGENTWAHELLLMRLMRAQGKKYLNLHTARIPYDKFFIFQNEYQTEYFSPSSQYQNTNDSKVINLSEKPGYFSLNNSLVKKRNNFFGAIKRLSDYVGGTYRDSQDPCRLTGIEIIKARINELINYHVYHKFVNTVQLEDVTSPFILYALHKQPESSIDVLGRYYEDQFLNIKNLWRILPEGWQLVVKEHPNAIGDRSKNFYDKIIDLPGAYVLNENANMEEVIKRTEAVFTVTGTVALEATFKQKPSFTFAKTYFSEQGFSKDIGIKDFLENENISDIIINHRPCKDIDRKYRNFINLHTYHGIISDPVTDSRCMSKENINYLSEAIVDVTNR